MIESIRFVSRVKFLFQEASETLTKNLTDLKFWEQKMELSEKPIGIPLAQRADRQN